MIESTRARTYASRFLLSAFAFLILVISGCGGRSQPQTRPATPSPTHAVAVEATLPLADSDETWPEPSEARRWHDGLMTALEETAEAGSKLDAIRAKVMGLVDKCLGGYR